ncbi:MAG: hypothetical protein GTO45_25965 [Candidatus Aminicenantes bacterium]|nr:hypothetical protein [Candidatus Aminicenantes bacterium]NIM82184.1 hypothetical protein [Candidatus Aminicenantes bacterium]NIN21586.1 hypothetical protein [Candidatus Aminicenantes bacterium]NIN45395.1 hypothetical protein [Candidatus Aminicenantes bacterium]NIN88216.1 hypothetical protein [Candidatus Aminicenantes bacterium]
MRKKLVFLTVLFFILVLSGCNLFQTNNDDNAGSSDTVLVSYEQVTTLSVQVLDQYLGILSTQWNALYGITLDSLIEATQYDVRIYKVIYKTYFKGEPVIVSGAVVIPETPGPYPVVSYQRGTIFRSQDAPSQFTTLFSGVPILVWGIVFSSSCGHVCSAPDLLGFAESRDIFHPYHHASDADTCVNMLRATREVCNDLNVELTNEYFLAGYSEGGYVTMALLKQITRKHKYEFPLVAVSIGGGAHDILSTMQQWLQGTVYPYTPIICFVIQGYLEYYDMDRNLNEIFQSPYAERLRDGLLKTEELDHFALADQLTPFIEELFTPQFLADFRGNGETQLKEALEENNLLKGWFPFAPVRIYQGNFDQIIPYSNFQAAHQYFGMFPYVQCIPLEGRSHGDGNFLFFIETVNWFSTFQ